MRIIDLGFELDDTSFQPTRVLKVSIPLELMEDGPSLSRKELAYILGQELLQGIEKLSGIGQPNNEDNVDNEND